MLRWYDELFVVFLPGGESLKRLESVSAPVYTFSTSVHCLSLVWMERFEYLFWNKVYPSQQKKKNPKKWRVWILLQSIRLIIKTSCNVNIQTFPEHLLKTVTLISAFSCFFIVFLCDVDVPLALNCFKGARLCLYQCDVEDTQQLLQLKADFIDYCLFVNRLICQKVEETCSLKCLKCRFIVI